MANKNKWDDFDLDLVTNFNTINTINTFNTNNTNNTNLCREVTKQGITSPADASGLASLPASQNIPSQVEVICSGVGKSRPRNLPKQWKGVKYDLFDNGTTKHGKQSLKLGLNIIRKDGTPFPLRCNLNSPTCRIWGGVSDEMKAEPHWQVIRSIEKEFKEFNIDYRVGKALALGKKGKFDIVCFLAEGDDAWLLVVVDRAIRYDYKLEKSVKLTSAQSKDGNIISSSGFIGNHADTISWLDKDAYGI